MEKYRDIVQEHIETVSKAASEHTIEVLTYGLLDTATAQKIYNAEIEKLDYLEKLYPQITWAADIRKRLVETYKGRERCDDCKVVARSQFP